MCPGSPHQLLKASRFWSRGRARSAPGWARRRCRRWGRSAGGGALDTPDRANLKGFVDELAGPADVAVLVVAAELTGSLDGPALVTGGQHRDYPGEATLPLSWLQARLRACRAERLMAV